MNDKVKKLSVTTPQGEAGALHRDSRYSFNYTTVDRAAEVALAMPIRPESYSSGALPIAFSMNKPEGILLSKLMAKFAKLGGLDDMKLLSIVGHNQIGRLQYSDSANERNKPLAPQIGLTDLLKEPSTESLFDFLIDAYLESGISGVQPKVMIPDADEVPTVSERATALHANLIVKSGGDDFPFLAQNEFLCMEAARLSGISVPEFWLSNDGGLFVMKRFDLQDGNPLGFEDMSLLTGKNPDAHGAYKYQSSYENIAKVIHLYCRDDVLDSAQRLFEYVALSVMVRNGDAHLKNFGLLYEFPTASRAPALAPLYDVVTTSVYPHVNSLTGARWVDRTMALNMDKEKDYPTRAKLLKFGADVCHVSKPSEVIDRIASGMSEALSIHSGKIDSGFLSKMSDEWDRGRLSVEPSRVFANR